VADRRNAIFLDILLSPTPVKLQDIADKFYISRGTVDNDIKELKNTIQKEGLEFTGGPDGLTISAPERLRRRVAVKNVFDRFNKVGIGRGDTKNAARIPESLKQIVKPATLAVIQRVLAQFEQETRLVITDYEYQSLLVHLIIAIDRIRHHKVLQTGDDHITIQPETRLLIKMLEKETGLTIPAYERSYLNIHVLAIQNKGVDVRELQASDRIGGFTGLPGLLKQSLPSYDDQLINNLALHLRPALKRFILGLQIYNPYTKEIQKHYPEAFDQALRLVHKLESIFDIKIDNDETAYLAMHIEAYLERITSDHSVSAVIVCSTGLGTAQLLKQRLEKYFPQQLNIRRVMSVGELLTTTVTEDIIISTIPLDKTEKPVLTMTPFFDEKDANGLENVIDHIKSEKADSGSFIRLIHFDSMFLHGREKTASAVIRYIGEQLVNQEFITNGAIQSALHREQLASTALSESPIALPHTEIQYVKKPVIAIYTSESGIDWFGQTVHIVFFLALNKQVSAEINDIYRYFNQLLEDRHILRQIIEETDKNQVMKLLKG
jgi:transcriptional antiterminator